MHVYSYQGLSLALILLTCIAENTAWLILHSSYTNRRGVKNVLRLYDKYIVSYLSINESLLPSVFYKCLSSQLPALVQQIFMLQLLLLTSLSLPIPLTLESRAKMLLIVCTWCMAALNYSLNRHMYDR